MPGKTPLLADIVAICVGVEGLQIRENQGGDEVGEVVVHGCLLLTGLPFWGDTKVGGKGCVESGRCGYRACVLLFLTFSLSSSIKRE